MVKKKIIAFGLAASVVVASVSASAGTMASTTLSGTGAQTGLVHLGSGDHTLKVQGTSGSGTAKVKEEKRWFPDETVATVTVVSPASGQNTFTATSTSGGLNQSYYVKWSGTKTSSAIVEITH